MDGKYRGHPVTCKSEELTPIESPQQGIQVEQVLYEILVCDSATLESLFRSNWPLRRPEAALNPDRSGKANKGVKSAVDSY
jgi:hypothetical protein